jgi:hypothetical protein
MSVRDVTAERELVPHIDPPTDLPDGWVIRSWDVYIGDGHWREMSLRIGFFHLPTGVQAEVEWGDAAPGMDFSWARDYLAFVASCPVNVLGRAQGHRVFR